MSISADVSKHLFRDLLDDAAMFPPGNAAPAEALTAHLGWRGDQHADLVGPLLVRADRWAELAATPGAADQPFDVAVIGSTHLPEPMLDRTTVVGFEVVWDGGEIPPAPGRLALEPAVLDQVEDLLADVGELRIDGRPVVAKFRTGGTDAAAFPSDADLAFCLLAAFNAGVPAKLTAGLHHAVRHTAAATGFEHHGFLNIMSAVRCCIEGGDVDAVAEVLAERDPAPLVDAAHAWSVDDALAIRSVFLSFGCCGVGEPIGDLVELGLLPGARR